MTSVSSSGISSGSILNRIRLMDKNAWDQFVDIYGPLIHRWCLQSGMTPADAADISQEVFALVLKSVSGYRNTRNGSFRGWLWTITRNRVRDFFRQQPSQPHLSGGTDLQIRLSQIADPIDVFDDQTHEDPTTSTQSAELISRAMHQIQSEIAPTTWKAFWRSVIDGDKTADIAEELGLSCNNVRQAKSRVLRRLRQQLGEQ